MQEDALSEFVAAFRENSMTGKQQITATSILAGKDAAARNEIADMLKLEKLPAADLSRMGL